MRQMKIWLGLRWISFTSFAFLMVEAVPLSERKTRQVSECIAGCPPGHQLNKACCEDGSTCTKSDICEKCVDGTYLLGEGIEAYCSSCIVCQPNEVQLQNCTEETNAKCECKPDYYRSSSQICLKCPECIKADCPAGCSPKSPPPQGIPTTTIERKDGTIRHDLPHPTDLTTPTNVREMSSSTMSSIIVLDGEPEDESWLKDYIYPMIFSAVFLLALIGVAINVLCCWTERSKKFWTNFCPCFRRYNYCKPNDNDQSASSSSTAPENTQNTAKNCMFCNCCVSGINVTQDVGFGLNEMGDIQSNSGNSPNKQNSDEGDAVQSEEKDPLLDSTDSNKSGPGSNGHNGDSIISRKHIPASQPVMPEPEKFFLPKKYRTDTSTVTIPIISDVSHLIGDKVTIFGGLLELKKGEIENIEHAHKSNLEKQNYEVLHTWMLNKGHKATKKRLAEVLIKIGRAKETVQYIWPELQPGTIPEEQEEIILDADAAKAAEISEDDFIKTFSRDSSQLFQTNLSETAINNDVNAMKNEDCLYVPKFSVNKKELQTLIGSDWISDVVINAFLAILAFEFNKLGKGRIFLLPTYIASSWDSPYLPPWMATKWNHLILTCITMLFKLY